MILILFLILLEVVTILVLKERFYKDSPNKFWLSVVIHSFLSIYIWYLLFRILFYHGEFDTPENIWQRTNMMGVIIAVIIPRIMLFVFHYTGKIIRIIQKGYVKFLTDSGLVICAVILIIISIGTFYSRNNFRVEKIEIRISGLNPDLNGLKIAQISDLHLSSYHKRMQQLEKAINVINALDPDIIINTGDFVTYGAGEYGNCDTTLVKQKSRFGNYAVLGNHDMGTYMPQKTTTWVNENQNKLNRLIAKSGYLLLADTNKIIKIKNAEVALIGVTTAGRYPDIKHGDVRKAMEGIESSDFRILLAHDPNQWEEDVSGKTNIDLTLSGHTHGMQFGIITKNFRWSPSKYIYSHWNGLYSSGNQYHYVNRGLGLLAIPFRIWMPPEITLLILKSE